MLLIVLLKVSSHFAVVEYMQMALLLTTQRAGSIVLFLQLQIGIVWKGVMCGIKRELHGVGYRPWTAFAHTSAVSEVVAQSSTEV